MKKTLPIIIIVLALIITTVAIIFAIINDKEKTMDENTIIIRNNYGELSTNSTDNVLIRKELLNKLNTFDEENYENVHNEYLELLNKYNENIAKIDANIEAMNSRCDVEYEDATINILCRSYSDLYEEIVNIYITNLNNYNNKIAGYNTRNQTNYEKYNMLHTEYLDINKDGTYQGL